MEQDGPMVLVQWYCEAIVKYGMHRPFRMEQDGPVRDGQRTKDRLISFGPILATHGRTDHP